jgi:CRP/FNR family transcriptional regulator, cyclic AMP receptor protein
MADQLSTLRQISLFSELSDSTLQQISRIAFRCKFERGEMILLEGDPCSAVYFISSGEVRIFRLNQSGREQVLVKLGSGSAFNTVPPFQPQPVNQASGRALTDVTLFAIRTQDYCQILLKCPDLTMVILQDFADRLVHITNLVGDLALHSVRGRLAKFLLNQANSDHIARPWTQDEIAIHLGAVRDVIGRTLRAFKEEGLIDSQRQNLILLDRVRLEDEAQY